MSDIKIHQWKTALSSCEELYFVDFVHDSLLQLTVEDEGGNRFIIEVDNPGPYRVYDEQYLTDYWSTRGEGIGWSFTVEDSEWDNIHPELLEVFQPDSKHYVVATLDFCLEILAPIEPTVRTFNQ